MFEVDQPRCAATACAAACRRRRSGRRRTARARRRRRRRSCRSGRLLPGPWRQSSVCRCRAGDSPCPRGSGSTAAALMPLSEPRAAAARSGRAARRPCRRGYRVGAAERGGSGVGQLVPAGRVRRALDDDAGRSARTCDRHRVGDGRSALEPGRRDHPDPRRGGAGEGAAERREPPGVEHRRAGVADSSRSRPAASSASVRRKPAQPLRLAGARARRCRAGSRSVLGLAPVGDEARPGRRCRSAAPRSRRGRARRRAPGTRRRAGAGRGASCGPHSNTKPDWPISRRLADAVLHLARLPRSPWKRPSRMRSKSFGGTNWSTGVATPRRWSG